MVARAGRLQSAFTAGELEPLLGERDELKYFNNGAKRAENVEFMPQGGFRNRDGLRHIGDTDAAAKRIFGFNASNGAAYDLVFSDQLCEVWTATAKATQFAVNATDAMLPRLNSAQQLDTMILFHNDLAPQRLKHAGAASWSTDLAPFEEIQTYDYGGPIGGGDYTNGVPAEWELEFVGLAAGSVTPADTFAISVAKDGGAATNTFSVSYSDDMTVLASRVETALEALAAVSTDLTVASKSGDASGNRVVVTFAGANIPSDWSLENATGNPAGIVFVKTIEGDNSTIAEVWEIEFNGLSPDTASGGSVFNLTVSNQETLSITYTSNMTVLAASIQTAILDLPNTAAGITVASSSGSSSGNKVTVTFDGTGNEGDGWALSGTIINKADAAILAYKTVPGISPGEPVISADRGWPRCGAFYAQRLFMGGFKSLPNAYLVSKAGDYYNFDDRFEEANGPFLLPMDIPGGEAIERIVPNRNLLIFTTEAEFWLAERTISKTEPPNHVQSSRHGVRAGVPIVENEGAAVFVHKNGGVIGEYRYTDVDGNYTALDISLLASHMVRGVRDLAQKRATISTDGHHLAMVLDDNSALQATLLREQDVTAFARVTTPGTFQAVCTNGRNEVSWLVDRNGARRLERFEDGLLLDGAITQAFAPAVTTVTGLAQFNGAEVWAIADDNVFGPFTVAGGEIELPIAVADVTVGMWAAPVVKTLPPPQRVGPNIVVKKRQRIHSVQISVIDTTSIAIGVNGNAAKDIDLLRYGAPADVPELQAGYTGLVKIRGLTGHVDEPEITITQTRPGRLTVRSVTLERA